MNNKNVEALIEKIAELIREAEDTGEIPQGVNTYLLLDSYLLLANAQYKGIFRVGHGHIGMLEDTLDFALSAHQRVVLEDNRPV